jgi:hypothetical protein
VIVERGRPRLLMLACSCGCGEEFPVNHSTRGQGRHGGSIAIGETA